VRERERERERGEGNKRRKGRREGERDDAKKCLYEKIENEKMHSEK